MAIEQEGLNTWNLFFFFFNYFQRKWQWRKKMLCLVLLEIHVHMSAAIDVTIVRFYITGSIKPKDRPIIMTG